jgi:hypothetical protein
VHLEDEVQRRADVHLRGYRYAVKLWWHPETGYTGSVPVIHLHARGRSLEHVLERLRIEINRYETATTSALVS